MRNLTWALALSFIIPNVSFALFCPKNFNVIQIGDSIDSVTAQCGKPDTETKKEVEKQGPQEWTYFMPQTVATNTSYQTTGTLKVSIAFDKNDKAININVNGIGVGESTICGLPINLDNSREQIKKACGKPAVVTKSSDDDSSTGNDKDVLVEYQYLSSPPVVLMFKNGVLTGSR
jgi:hypothetical protein